MRITACRADQCCWMTSSTPAMIDLIFFWKMAVSSSAAICSLRSSAWAICFSSRSLSAAARKRTLRLYA
eukprot:7384174-Prymnesium_polylepis.1